MLARRSPATDPWQPMYERKDADAFVIGLYVEPQHCNFPGTLHGGVLSALADNAMIYGCLDTIAERDPSAGLATVSMNVDFLGGAKPGDWVSVHGSLVKSGKSLHFAQCLGYAGERLILRASSVLKQL